MTLGMGMNLALVVLLAIGLLEGIIVGCKRGVLRAGVRTATLLLSAFGAYLIAKALINTYGPTVEQTVGTLLENMAAEVAELFHASPTMLHYLTDIATALVAPLMFLVLFIVLRLFSLLVYGVICIFLPKRKHETVVDKNGNQHRGRRKPLNPLSRLFGVALSCCGALLIVFCLMMPMTGYLDYAATVYPMAKETGVVPEDVVPASIDAQVEEIHECRAVTVIGRLGGKAAFSKLTVMQDGSSHATDETMILLNLVPAVMGVQEIDFDAAFEAEKPLDLSPIDEGILPAIANSAQLRQILAEIMKEAGTKWNANEEFLGINIKEQLPDAYKNSLDAALVRLSVTTSEKVIGDLQDLTDTVELVSATYNYMVAVSDTTYVTPEQLQSKMNDILNQLTPGNAELLSAAISDEIVGNANLAGNKSAGTLAGIVSGALTEVAEMPADSEERNAESEAINQLFSYASTSRSETVSSDELLDSYLSSQALKNSVTEEVNNADPETGETAQVTVSATQKAAIDAEVEKRLADDELSEEDRAALEALKDLFKAQNV